MLILQPRIIENHSMSKTPDLGLVAHCERLISGLAIAHVLCTANLKRDVSKIDNELLSELLVSLSVE